jgi:lipid-binding SYLF domain-containing protein
MIGKRTTGITTLGRALALGVLLMTARLVHADSYTETIATFKNAGGSADFFHHCYGYAVFPTVGEGAFIVGGAVGKGRVYMHKHLVGDTTMGQVSVGFQAGGKAYSQIIFFEDKRALDEFESGKFEFGAGASATAITASAGASAGTNGAQAGASGTVNNATTTGAYNKGMAVFTIAKGGLMYAAAIEGQKFSYTPRGQGSSAARHEAGNK